MLTQERADILTKYLSADADKAEKLLGMEPEKALEEINAAGFDFTMDELNEYCAAFKAAVAVQGEGELNADALDNVAGGIVLTGAMVAGLVGCFVGGAAIGIAAGAKW